MTAQEQEEGAREALEPPKVRWVEDDPDTGAGHWIYPSQRELDEYRRVRARAGLSNLQEVDDGR
jgi:hypothetical protein